MMTDMELKASTAHSIADEEAMLELWADSPIESAQVYLKYEADKVIARHKYKRCLAMAELCDAEADVADADGDYEDMRWFQKWHKRWLELAEKFKPNNQTAQ